MNEVTPRPEPRFNDDCDVTIGDVGYVTIRHPRGLRVNVSARLVLRAAGVVLAQALALVPGPVRDRSHEDAAAVDRRVDIGMAAMVLAGIVVIYAMYRSLSSGVH